MCLSLVGTYIRHGFGKRPPTPEDGHKAPSEESIEERVPAMLATATPEPVFLTHGTGMMEPWPSNQKSTQPVSAS